MRPECDRALSCWRMRLRSWIADTVWYNNVFWGGIVSMDPHVRCSFFISDTASHHHRSSTEPIRFHYADISRPIALVLYSPNPHTSISKIQTESAIVSPQNLISNWLSVLFWGRCEEVTFAPECLFEELSFAQFWCFHASNITTNKEQG